MVGAISGKRAELRGKLLPHVFSRGRCIDVNRAQPRPPGTVVSDQRRRSLGEEFDFLPDQRFVVVAATRAITARVTANPLEDRFRRATQFNYFINNHQAVDGLGLPDVARQAIQHDHGIVLHTGLTEKGGEDPFGQRELPVLQQRPPRKHPAEELDFFRSKPCGGRIGTGCRTKILTEVEMQAPPRP